MELFFNQVFAGIAVGSIYACLALALSVTYKSTRIINFAQGEMAMASTYMAWYAMHLGLGFWPAFAIALVGSFLFSSLTELIFITPFEDDPPLNKIVVTIGLMLGLNSLAGWIFGYETQSLEIPFSKPFIDVFGFALSVSDAATFLLAWLGIALVFLFFRFTASGLYMRAVAQNPDSCKALGIRVRLVRAASWGLAGTIGGAAGIFSAPSLFVSPQMMRGVIIYALAAAVLGGLESPVGGAICGVLLGVLENLIGTYVGFIGSGLKLSVALVVLLIVLFFKPDGVFGKPEVNRV